MWSFPCPFCEKSTLTERTQIPHSYLTGLFAMATESAAYGYCSFKSFCLCKGASWPMTAQNRIFTITLLIYTWARWVVPMDVNQYLKLVMLNIVSEQGNGEREREEKPSAISEPAHPKINQSRRSDDTLLRKCRWVKSPLNPSRSEGDSAVRHSSDDQIKPRMGAVTRVNAAPVAFVVWR